VDRSALDAPELDGVLGTFQFAFRTERFQPIGTVSPRSRVLAPGQTGSFAIAIPLPAQPGDLGVRLVLATGHDGDGSIPVTLRSLVPLQPGGGTFHGVLTGGNGRPIFGGQTLAFQFDVPAGEPSSTWRWRCGTRTTT